MSQVNFKTQYLGKPVEVMAGWDRPLGHYFMTIFDLAPDSDEETVWSTLDNPAKFDLKGIQIKLYQLGIEEPDGFWMRVELQEGNVLHTFENGGWFRKEL